MFSSCACGQHCASIGFCIQSDHLQISVVPAAASVAAPAAATVAPPPPPAAAAPVVPPTVAVFDSPKLPRDDTVGSLLLGFYCNSRVRDLSAMLLVFCALY